MPRPSRRSAGSWRRSCRLRSTSRPARLRAAVPTLPVAQEARQLRGERLAGRDLLLVVEDLRALLELGDVGGGLVVGCNRFADLLAVALRGFVELAGLDRRAEDVT